MKHSNDFITFMSFGYICFIYGMAINRDKDYIILFAVLVIPLSVLFAHILHLDHKKENDKK